MNEDDKDDGTDPDLAAWLRLWKAPEAPEGLGDRLRTSYRAAGLGGSFWKRLRRRHVNLSLPLAALIVGAVLAVGVLVGKLSSRSLPPRTAPRRAEDSGRAGLANLRPLAEVQVTILKKGDGPDDPR